MLRVITMVRATIILPGTPLQGCVENSKADRRSERGHLGTSHTGNELPPPLSIASFCECQSYGTVARL